MNKTDKSKHNISIAAIKRSTFKPYDYELTKFYESNSEFPYRGMELDLTENELIICSTVVDSENYSVLTTQKLITKENGIKNIGNLIGAKDKLYGDFKGYKDKSYTFGFVELNNGTDFKYFFTKTLSRKGCHGFYFIFHRNVVTKICHDEIVTKNCYD